MKTTSGGQLLAMITHLAVQTSTRRLFSQYYFVHRYLNNAQYIKSHFLFGKPFWSNNWYWWPLLGSFKGAFNALIAMTPNPAVQSSTRTFFDNGILFIDTSSNATWFFNSVTENICHYSKRVRTCLFLYWRPEYCYGTTRARESLN